jgi:hypothetical protein
MRSWSHLTSEPEVSAADDETVASDTLVAVRGLSQRNDVAWHPELRVLQALLAKASDEPWPSLQVQSWWMRSRVS